MIGSSAAVTWSPLTALGSALPVIEMVAADSSRPSSSAPESPMNSRAGLKLCGRKPRQQPRVAAMTKVAVEKTLAGVNRKLMA